MPSTSDQKLYRTRFDDGEQRLLYGHVEGTNVGYDPTNHKASRQVSFWSFFHQWGTDEPRRVGPEYPSREALVAAMENYGNDFGFGDCGQKSKPCVQTMGRRTTSIGSMTRLRIYTNDYRQLSWEEVWEAFTAIYPNRWAVQFFPPAQKLVNDTNIYHLFMLDEVPYGVEILPGR